MLAVGPVVSLDARRGVVVAEVARRTTPDQASEICERGAARAADLDRLGRRGRAAMLAAMAEALEARRAEIVSLADMETALGAGRLDGELTRTCAQLRFMAEVITDGAYLEAVLDHARQTVTGQQPDIRRMLQPLGLVAVFGASNFPLAFSVPGGDTASALAAGCPVVAKVHDAHPATSVACAEALREGAKRAGVDFPVVSLVFGEEAGVAVVKHSAVRAVGFTGSLKAGRYLFDIANQRPDPVPFYGELGALNPVVVGPAAAEARAGDIASGLATSYTLGVGQFCTKPGLVLLPEGSGGDAVRDLLAEAVRAMGPGLMLSERIAAAFVAGSTTLREFAGVRVVATGGVPDAGASAGWWGVPVVLEAGPGPMSEPMLQECFGPLIILQRYSGAAHLSELVKALEPALTATFHADAADEALLDGVLGQLARKVGRLVWNGYPTGLAVTWATHHGGPYPATTAPLHTSVGAAAIKRWLQPVSYQNFPSHLLPPELQDAAPGGVAVLRRVDSRLTLPAHS
ncbi:MAG TPA: aldehyde dehydrogenase family protein [Acidimicrobiales bacterium]|nr:aldehyde dehydrogenase family protein [Acidimicrobiales bacterium]